MNSNTEYFMMCSQIATLRKALRKIEQMRWELPVEYRNVASDALQQSRNTEVHYRNRDDREAYFAKVVHQSKIADGTIPRDESELNEGIVVASEIAMDWY